MKKAKLPPELLEIARSASKRARIVIEHIMKHGFITTEHLEKTYGYNHPPRAARDVREAGIPLETFKVKSSDGRSIAAYRFGDFSKIERDKLGGRTVFSREFKEELYEANNGKCYICSTHFEIRYLQIDHRVPYEVSGDDENIEKSPEEYMLLCGSCNRAKSWSCEHCSNWLVEKSSEICLRCYWGSPEDYYHIALREVRRLDIIWEEEEVRKYERLKKLSAKKKESLPEYVKKVLNKHVSGNNV